MEKKPRKAARIELTREPKQQTERPSSDASDAAELKLDQELEERVTPRPIGTFF